MRKSRINVLKNGWNIFAIAVLVMMLTITGCANSEVSAIDETETAVETIRKETESETAAPPETTQAETEPATTAAETEAAEEAYEPAQTYSTSQLSFEIPGIADSVSSEMPWEAPPEMGETRRVNYFIYDPEKIPEEYGTAKEGKSLGFEADLKTVSIPEWGIYRISVDPNLFPEDEGIIYSVQEDETDIIKVGDDVVQKIRDESPYGAIFAVVPNSEDQLIYLDKKGVREGGCIEDEELYYGSFSRESELGTLRMWARETELDPSSEEVLNMSPEELMVELYPYMSDGIRLGKNFHGMGADGYKYIYLECTELKPWIQASESEQSGRTGAILFRFKDGICEGIMYTSPYTEGFKLANYVLNQSIVFDELTDETGGYLCNHYYGIENNP